MPTVYDAKKWIFDQLVTAKTNSEIVIGGKVYIDKKPGVGKEDIVINSILMDSEFFQNAVLNVNCYVPDTSIRDEGRVIKMPDTDRLGVIAGDVYAVLKDSTESQT